VWVDAITNIKGDGQLLEIPEACRPLCSTPAIRRELLRSMPAFDVIGPAAPALQTPLTIRDSGESRGVARAAEEEASGQAQAKRPRLEAGGSSGGASSSAAGGSSSAAGASSSQAGEVLPPPPPGPPPATAIRAESPALVAPSRRLVRGDGTPVGDPAAPKHKQAKAVAPRETSPRRWRAGRLHVVPR